MANTRPGVPKSKAKAGKKKSAALRATGTAVATITTTLTAIPQVTAPSQPSPEEAPMQDMNSQPIRNAKQNDEDVSMSCRNCYLHLIKCNRALPDQDCHNCTLTKTRCLPNRVIVSDAKNEDVSIKTEQSEDCGASGKSAAKGAKRKVTEAGVADESGEAAPAPKKARRRGKGAASTTANTGGGGSTTVASQTTKTATSALFDSTTKLRGRPPTKKGNKSTTTQAAPEGSTRSKNKRSRAAVPETPELTFGLDPTELQSLRWSQPLAPILIPARLSGQPIQPLIQGEGDECAPKRPKKAVLPPNKTRNLARKPESLAIVQNQDIQFYAEIFREPENYERYMALDDLEKEAVRALWNMSRDEHVGGLKV